MAQFDPIQLNFEYQPVSLEELIAPLSLYKKEYDANVADLDKRSEGLAAFKPFINDGTPEAKARYDALDKQIEANAQYIGTPGYLLHERPIRALKGTYNKTIADFTNAVKNMEARKALTQQELSKHPGLVYNYLDKTGNFVDSPSIDNFLDNGNLDFYSVDTDDIMNKAMASAKGISSRLAASFPYSYVDPKTGYINTGATDYKGAPVRLRLDWFLHPDKYKDEITNFKNTYKGSEYSTLFDSSIASDIAALYDTTAYQNLDDMNKARVENAIEYGFNTGLGPYAIDKKFNLSGVGSHGGSGSSSEPDVPMPQTSPVVVTSEDATERTGIWDSLFGDPTDWERYKEAMKYFGTSDESFIETGNIPMLDRLALKGLVRSNDPEADKFINGDSFENFKKAGVKNFFSLFDENGDLLTQDDFTKKYSEELKDVSSDDYRKAMEGNPEIDEIYRKYFVNYDVQNPKTSQGAGPVPPSTTDDYEKYYNDRIKDLYSDAKKSILSLWRVPKKEADAIAKDKEKFKKWAEENGVNKYTIQQQMIKDADDFGNIKKDFQNFVFGEGGKIILGNVLKSNFDKDGKLQLKLIDKIQWKKNDMGIKEINFKTEDKEVESLDDLGDVIYELPPDPAKDGLIVRAKGNRYLIPPENLGSILNEDVKENCQKIEIYSQAKKEVYDMAYALPGVLNKLMNGGRFNAKEKKALKGVGVVDILDEPSQYSPEEKETIQRNIESAYPIIRQRLAAYNTNIERLVRDNTTLFKATLGNMYKSNKN